MEGGVESGVRRKPPDSSPFNNFTGGLWTLGIQLECGQGACIRNVKLVGSLLIEGNGLKCIPQVVVYTMIVALRMWAHMPNDKPEQKQAYGFRSTIIAEFVDAIPERTQKFNYNDTRTQWQQQPGVKEAFSLAMQNPNRALLMMEYNEGSPSRRRNQATNRVRAFVERQGYTEDNGWVIRAVDNKVYCMYTGAR